ncbi:hypothetical protein AMS68_005730 [Peltaster fructicola]|uniref:Heterokaryon incompatibility domain-containing protein n=1 Tax=Peltaster fructicola TaxID=286661 RepID=A0A6H0XZM7_9PEZI|nr:hypothetical protein AMS68_005730 [Peltaster fructicola]
MDHLQLPQSSHSEPERVSCVCADNELYDSGPFATFPSRHEWPDLVAVGETSYFIVDSHKDISAETLRKREKILQAWVFFGLLHEMLSPFDLYHAHEYVDIDADGKRWLHTRKLKQRIATWRNTIRGAEESRRQSLLTHFEECTRAAVTALYLLSNANHRDFNRMIKISLLAICDTARGMIQKQLDTNASLLGPWMKLGDDILDRSTMLRNGWCPSEITAVRYKHSRGIFSLWYLQHMKRPCSPDVHKYCTDQDCCKSQSSDKQWPRHVKSSCDCSFLGPNEREIVECIQAEDIPVLEIRGEGLDELSLAVHRFSTLDKGETAYVAISHVWADGLGNTIDNTLPRCQVQRLNDLLLAIKRHRIYNNDELYDHKKRVMLWCDTLCVPVNVHKAVAMRKMREVYIQAAFVLVLDNELQKYRYSDIGTVEAGWRIFLSQYMTRLWTYQEAGLASRLIIQFADAPIDILPIVKTAYELHCEAPFSDPLYDIIGKWTVLRGWFRAQPQTSWIKEAAQGVASRRVSYASDEPICLATVLGLDSEEVTRTPANRRTERLWQLVSQHDRGIHESVIFNTLPRLATQGFRWAPVSFLQPIERMLDFVTMPNDTNKGVLVARGLRVRRAGWRLQCEGPPGYFQDNFLRQTDMGSVTYAMHVDGSCYDIQADAEQDPTFMKHSLLDLVKDAKREWYIILQTPERAWEHARWTSQQLGILVSRETSEYGLSYYRTHLLVMIDRVSPDTELRRKAESTYSRFIRRSWLVRTLSFLLLIENLVTTYIGWFPERSQPFLTARAETLGRPLGRLFGHRLGRLVATVKDEAPKLPQVHRLLQRITNINARNKFGVFFPLAFMGRYVNVVEVFDPSTEWCVD